MRGRLALGGFAAALAAAITPAWAVAQEAKEPPPPLSVVGGTEARTVGLGPCENVDPDPAPAVAVLEGQCPRGQERALVGKLRLALDVVEGGDLRLLYLRDAADVPLIQPGPGDARFGVVAASNRIRLKRGELRRLNLRFAVPQGDSLDSLDGELALEHAGVRTVIRVTAPPPTLTAEPPSFAAECTDWLIMTDCDATKVELTGTAVPQLIETAVGKESIPVRLKQGLHTAEATLDEFTPDSSNPLAASARLHVSSDKDGRPGRTFKGSLTLLPGDKPTKLDVELKHGFAGLIAFAVIGLGVLLGALLPRWRAFSRRRKLLRRYLDAAVAAYKQRRGSICAAPASYRLDDLLNAQRDKEYSTVDSLREAIEEARSDADLDEDTGRVLDLIARLQRWLRIEPAARRFRIVVTGEPKHTPSLPPAGWHDTATWHDAQALFAALRNEPADADAADTLVEQLLWQTRWHHRMEAAWNAAGGSKGEIDKLHEKLAAKSALDRSAAERAVLEAQLDRLVESLPNDQLEVPGEGQSKLGDDALDKVDWGASAFSFRGWATLDGPRYLQLLERAMTTGRAIESDDANAVPEARPNPEGRGRRRLGAFLASLPALALASALYLLEVYEDDWGSVSDFLTAFLAGTLAKVAIDWAKLPLFRSLRLRKPAS